MKKVTRKKLWQGFILLTLFCNTLGVCFELSVENSWGALGHAACGLLTVILYLDTLEEGTEEEVEDEQ